MEVYIWQWLGLIDQFRIRTDVKSAVSFLRSMRHHSTKGTLRFCAMYSHIPDDYQFTGGSDNEYVYFNLSCPATEAHKILEVLEGDLSRFKGDLYLTNDVTMPETKGVHNV